MLEQVGRPRRIGLVVPDPVAKVSLVRFEQVPARAQDLDQLMRWQVRKTAPFPIEEAQVSYVRGAARRRRPGIRRRRSRGATSSRSTRRCARRPARTPGSSISSTFNVINAVLGRIAARRRRDWLLVNVAPDYASIAILRGAASDLLPQPRGRTPKARSPISCTRRRCTTRIG